MLWYYYLVGKTGIDIAIKRQKLSNRIEEVVKNEKSVGDISMKRVTVRDENSNTSRSKVVRPKFAVGGLDQDLLGWADGGGSSALDRRTRKADSKDKSFTDFDASKRLRKGGKVGTSSFKSKSKFKRRK
jgi:hypothetical protein